VTCLLNNISKPQNHGRGRSKGGQWTDREGEPRNPTSEVGERRSGHEEAEGVGQEEGEVPQRQQQHQPPVPHPARKGGGRRTGGWEAEGGILFSSLLFGRSPKSGRKREHEKSTGLLFIYRPHPLQPRHISNLWGA